VSRFRIASEQLTDFVNRIFVAAGVPATDAQVVATSLVGANLRGHDSHGVMRVPQYVEFIREGSYRLNVPLKIERESPALLVCDGQWGLGQVQAHRLVERTLPKAREMGLAAGTGRHFGHIGRLGEYAERVAAEGCILIATVNNGGAGQRVAPPGGREPRLGTNPLCAVIPTPNKNEPILLDFGTSVAAEGKVRVHHINGTPVPPGWLLDSEGQPTTDPSVLYQTPSGSILPMGGDQSYKGFGLALVLDLLAGGLTGGEVCHAGAPPARGNNIVFVILDPEHFAGRTRLIDQAGALSEFVRSSKRVTDEEPIRLPGDPERAAFVERSELGIPLDPNHWSKLTTLAQQLGVAVPST
jgi:uncharacterized oxidoreductase